MSRADLNQSEIVSALRSVGATVTILSQAGEGVPDLLVGIFLKNFLLETKNPDYNWKLTPKQIIWHAQWKGQKAIVESVDEALRVIGVEV